MVDLVEIHNTWLIMSSYDYTLVKRSVDEINLKNLIVPYILALDGNFFKWILFMIDIGAGVLLIEEHEAEVIVVKRTLLSKLTMKMVRK